MEEEINTFASIIINDPLIKDDFISCLDQYILLGNLGRDRIKEEQIKLKLAQYSLQPKLKIFLMREDFFYLPYGKFSSI